MTTQCREDAQADHTIWRYENHLEFEDVARWQNDIDAIRANVRQIDKALKEHKEAIVVHAYRVHTHRQLLDKHHRHLSADDETNDSHDDMENLHRQQAERLLRNRTTHEMIREQHKALMESLHSLTDLCPAEVKPPYALLTDGEG